MAWLFASCHSSRCLLLLDQLIKVPMYFINYISFHSFISLFHPFIHSSIHYHLSFIHLLPPIYHPSIKTSIHPSIYLFVYLFSIRPSIKLSFYQSIRQFIFFLIHIFNLAGIEPSTSRSDAHQQLQTPYHMGHASTP